MSAGLGLSQILSLQDWPGVGLVLVTRRARERGPDCHVGLGVQVAVPRPRRLVTTGGDPVPHQKTRSDCGRGLRLAARRSRGRRPSRRRARDAGRGQCSKFLSWANHFNTFMVRDCGLVFLK